MRPTMQDCQERLRRNRHETFLHQRSVLQLIKEFEARAINITTYASAQNLLTINSESNRRHMSLRAKPIKVNRWDSDTINSNVCSLISSTVDNDSQIVSVDIQTQNVNDCKQTVSSLLNTTTDMSARSTDIDQAALTLGQRHNTHTDELHTKETQFNHALTDLILISNNVSSINHSDQRHISSSTTSRNHNISTCINLLNHLLESLDSNDEICNLNKPTKEIHRDQPNQTNTDNHIKPINMFCLMLSDKVCANCHQAFATNEQIVNAAGQIWHTHCFVCTQCFQPFENGIYFEYEDRKYCERDFQMLFAPYCAECKQAIVGRIIRAVQKCFHPDCFRCQLCQISLVDMGFSKHNGRALCRECHAKEKATDLKLSKQICSTCHQLIDNKYLQYKGEYHHAYHFKCITCCTELDENSREVRGSLYCLPCHNKLDIPVCAACRRLIDDRVVSALGKQWHVEHFCCARCAQPFYGSKHFEHKGLAYCESDYHILFGSTCFICNCIITEGAYTACNKKYCAEHFACSFCEKKMNEKSKFFDVDAVPVCKQCYGKLPSNIRKSIEQPKKKQLTSLLKQTSV